MDRAAIGAFLRAALEVAWLFVLCVAGAFLVFAGSHDGSLVGGRFPAAALWALLWLGTLAVRTPPVVPVPVAIAVAVAGIPVALLALTPSAPVFAALIVVLWLGLSFVHVAWQRRLEQSAR